MRFTPSRRGWAWIAALVALGLPPTGALALTGTPSASTSTPVASLGSHPFDSVHLTISGLTATLSNYSSTISFNDQGIGTSATWHGKQLIGRAKGFYLSVNGSTPFVPTALTVVTDTPQLANIAYTGTWGELHYVMQAGVSGMYSYFVAKDIGTVGEFRTLYRVDGSIFRNGFNGVRNGLFPTLSDILASTKVQDETFQLADGTIYSKYDWANNQAADRLHGMYGGGLGVWMIPATHEYNNGGPMKQELMVHVESRTGDGVILNMLSASHFGAPAVTIPSGKVYGPWLLYFNDGNIHDAQARAALERASWPYRWLTDPNYPLARTTVTGRLLLAGGRPAAAATVALGRPGGDLSVQGADYITWATADALGYFVIPKVRPGSYTLYAFAHGGPTQGHAIGSVTDQFSKDGVVVAGSHRYLGTMIWKPTVYGHSLWQIGTSDRTASEFALGNLPRQYGLFKQVPADLTYTLGSSSPAKDWYYAQTKPGTWTVNFYARRKYPGAAHLTIALAGATRKAAVNVGVNGTRVGAFPSFANDMSIYRNADESGVYHLLTFDFPTSLLKVGMNSITLNATAVSAGGGVMYDIVKLETD